MVIGISLVILILIIKYVYPIHEVWGGGLLNQLFLFGVLFTIAIIVDRALP